MILLVPHAYDGKQDDRDRRPSSTRVRCITNLTGKLLLIPSIPPKQVGWTCPDTSAAQFIPNRAIQSYHYLVGCHYHGNAE